MDNIIAFVPARKGSKSIPSKNIKLLGGKPLLTYSIESALKCGLRTIVSTNDEEIAQIAKEYNAEVMMRPASLAKDDTSMFDVLRNEIPKITPKPNLILLLQPTSPFRKSVHIKTAISYLQENLDKYDSIISVERVPEKYDPYAMILENKRMVFRKLVGWKEKIKSWFTGKKYAGPLLSGYPINQRMTRRQELPQCWLPTGEIYAFKSENLKKGNLYGDRVMLYECGGSININTEANFEQAEEYFKQKNG